MIPKLPVRAAGILVAAFLLGCHARPLEPATGGPPNFLLIVTDDQGWGEAGFPCLSRPAHSTTGTVWGGPVSPLSTVH